MVRRHSRVVHLVVLGACAVLVSCSGEGSKVFGERTEPCRPVVLTNDGADAELVATGSACFLAEVDAGRAVTWDVLAVTVEGDPIPTRYEFDGSRVTITRDFRRDSYGSGGVDEERCDGVRRTNWLPEGIECGVFGGDGFRSDSLPGGG